MRSYKAFAEFYDLLTENVDYEVRSDYISNFFSEYGNGGKAVLDLACGTGSFAKLLSDKGYNLTGIDLSDEMLTIAKSKCPDISFLKADMTDFSFAEKFDFCICCLDSINHLCELGDVKKCFECVYKSLNDNGIFIFDVNTIYKHRNILADNTFVFDYEDFFLSWDNEYEGDDRIRILLDIFIFNGQNYDRFSEEFFEQAYSIDVLKKALSDFEVLAVFNELTQKNPTDESERIYFICKKVN